MPNLSAKLKAIGKRAQSVAIVTYFVETADGFLNTAAETQFGSVAAGVGTLIALGSTILIIFVFINMAFQMR